MDRNEIWLRCFTAAMSGYIAAETPDNAFQSRQELVNTAAVNADLGVKEYEKRFGKVHSGGN